MEYLIKWKDYPESANTWEPEQNLDCSALLRKFEQSFQQKRTAQETPKNSKSGERRNRANSSSVRDSPRKKLKVSVRV